MQKSCLITIQVPAVNSVTILCDLAIGADRSQTFTESLGPN